MGEGLAQSDATREALIYPKKFSLHSMASV
jgi:hypothetical protein